MYLNFRCRINGCDPSQPETSEFAPQWLNRTVLWGSSVPKLLQQCRRYNETWSDIDQCLNKYVDYETAELMECDEGLVYDLSSFHSTIVTEVFGKSLKR